MKKDIDPYLLRLLPAKGSQVFGGELSSPEKILQKVSYYGNLGLIKLKNNLYA